jgi:hypothetical protein
LLPSDSTTPTVGTYRTDAPATGASVRRFHAFRFDATRVSKTADGGLKIPAYLTREGVFTYRNDDGTERREYRPASEVFRDDSLATLEDVVVTDLHPAEMVKPETASAVTKGHVRDVRRDTNRVAGTVVVKDAALINAINSGARREISCGYTCDFDATPGVTTRGERYDGTQRNIVYNHAAVVPRGRAGSDVGLRLDSEDEATPMVIRFDGKDYDVSTPAGLAAYNVATAAVLAERDAQKSRADKAEGERDAAKTAAATASDPKRFDAAVAGRIALCASASKVLGPDAKLDGLTDRAVRELVIAKSDPAVKFDGKSDDYVLARFDTVIASPPAVVSGNDATRFALVSVEGLKFPTAQTVTNGAPLAPSGPRFALIKE